MGLVTEEKVHKGKDKGHNDSFTVASDGYVYSKRMNTVINSR